MVKTSKMMKTNKTIKGLQTVTVGETELLYFPVARGEYKGLYVYINPDLYDFGDLSLSIDERRKAALTVTRLRMQGYAVGVFESATDADEAVNDYIARKNN